MILVESHPYFRLLHDYAQKIGITATRRTVLLREEGNRPFVVTDYEGMVLVQASETLFFLCVGRRGSNGQKTVIKDGFRSLDGYIECLPVYAQEARVALELHWVIDRVAYSHTVRSYATTEERSRLTREYRSMLRAGHPVLPFVFELLSWRFHRDPVEALDRASSLVRSLGHLAPAEELMSAPAVLAAQALQAGVQRSTTTLRECGGYTLTNYDGYTLLDDNALLWLALGWHPSSSTALDYLRRGERERIFHEADGHIVLLPLLVQQAAWFTTVRWVMGHVAEQMKASYPVAQAAERNRAYHALLWRSSWAIPFVYQRLYRRVRKGYPLPLSAEQLLQEAMRLVEQIEQKGNNDRTGL